eukprot:294183-Chlamydomonas_euryale.AAC.4
MHMALQHMLVKPPYTHIHCSTGKGTCNHAPSSMHLNAVDCLHATTPLPDASDDERPVPSNKRASVPACEDATTYKIGHVLDGTVQSVQKYGALVASTDGQVGLLHISEISHERIKHVNEVFAVGDRLKAMVLTADQERGRISLSTRWLEQTPGDMLQRRQIVFEKAEETAKAFRNSADYAQMKKVGVTSPHVARCNAST